MPPPLHDMQGLILFLDPFQGDGKQTAALKKGIVIVNLPGLFGAVVLFKHQIPLAARFADEYILVLSTDTVGINVIRADDYSFAVCPGRFGKGVQELDRRADLFAVFAFEAVAASGSRSRQNQ